MDNMEKNTNNSIEVLDFFDDEVEVVPAQEVEPYKESTVEVQPMMSEMESYIEPIFSGFENMTEKENMDSRIEPVVNTNDFNYSSFDVEDDHKEESYANTVIPAIEPTEIVKTEEEKKILKDVEASTPTNLNDQLLKLEDTLSRNNLKEDIKKETDKDESKSNKKAISFIVIIFILLAVLIFCLPFLIKLF